MKLTLEYLAVILVLLSKHIVAQKCVPLSSASCFGTTLPYNYTSLSLAADSVTQKDIEKNLDRWSALSFVPKCWAVLQPFLCQIYKPECVGGNVSLPCRSQCLATRGPCAIVERYRDEGWPDFMDCDRFEDTMCNGTVVKIEINETQCKPPLVSTNHELSWYEGVEGCGLQCQNPIYSIDEHHRIHRFIASFGSLSILCTIFTMVTFLIGWSEQNRYPAVILFYFSSCFFVASVGFTLQFPGDMRDKIVCRSDQTMRLGEPKEKDSVPCVITFVLVYYFSMAGALWFVILAYSWHICFRTLGSTIDNFTGKVHYFHIIAWSLPIIPTAAVLLMNKVDANSLSGICFVGYQDGVTRAIFLLVPLGIDLIIGGKFLAQGLGTLYKLRKSNPRFISSKASQKIKETIVRVGIFSFLAFACVLATFACHAYEYAHQKLWEDSFIEYVKCFADETVHGRVRASTGKCIVKERPNLGVIELELISLFGAGIAMSAWTWTSNTLLTWKKAWHRLTGKKNVPELSHHRLIRRMRQNRVGPAAMIAPIPEHQITAAVSPGPLPEEAFSHIILSRPSTSTDLSAQRQRNMDLSLQSLESADISCLKSVSLDLPSSSSGQGHSHLIRR